MRCYDYPELPVKERDYGDHGDTAISVTPYPAARAARLKCAKQDDAGEMVVPGREARDFIGTKGGFIYVESTMGADPAPFTICDAKTGEAIYNNQSSSNNPLGLTVENDVLTLKYQHGAQANCSILTGGETCWLKFAREAHLPQATA